MAACPNCGAPLESPLACGACHTLLAPSAELSPFEVLGLTPAFSIDPKGLRKQLLKVSRWVHPDFFATAPLETREAAERASAQLNDAYELLSDDFRRADWLVQDLGGPNENDERQMPQAFLMEVLEWNEVLDAARDAGADSPEWSALDALETELSGERKRSFESVGASLDPLPEPESPSLTEVRRVLNALRYLERSLSQIRTMRLQQARSA